jgi:hypothetical protein
MIASWRSRLELHYKYLVFDGLSGQFFSLFWRTSSSLHNNVQAICQICCNFGHCLGLFMLCIWLCSMIVLLLLCFESRPENTDIFKVKISQREWTVAVCECFGFWHSNQGDIKVDHKLHLKECAKSVCVQCCLECLTYSADCCFLYQSLSWSQQHYRFTVSWLPLFLSIIFDKVCWILIDLVQKTDVKLLECVYFWRMPFCQMNHIRKYFSRKPMTRLLKWWHMSSLCKWTYKNSSK